MNPILRKLRAKTGASMVLSLLFLLLCMFTGSTALASATANSRQTSRNRTQQELLSRRSAAMVIAAELGTVPELTVTDTVQTSQRLLTLPGPGIDPVADPDRPAQSERILVFRAPFSGDNSMTALQRLVLEGAVCRYLQEQAIPSDTTVILQGFWYQGMEITDLHSFWYSPGTENFQGNLTIELSGEPGSAVSACFSFGDRREAYDFLVWLADNGITVRSEATVGTRTYEKPEQYLNHPEMGSIRLSETVAETCITWEKARIQKGGQE